LIAARPSAVGYAIDIDRRGRWRSRQRVSDFEDGDRKIVDVNGKSVGVFRIDDRFYALRNRCPHQFGPLCAGTLAPRAVSDGPGDVRMDSGPTLLACPWHP
jgi:nitrite reductase/ring-hydroxylating ferredoxin subunit